jgi:hypothetical protein
VIDRGGGRSADANGVAKNYGVSDIIGFGGAIYLGVSSPVHGKPPARCCACVPTTCSRW